MPNVDPLEKSLAPCAMLVMRLSRTPSPVWGKPSEFEGSITVSVTTLPLVSLPFPTMTVIKPYVGSTVEYRSYETLWPHSKLPPFGVSADGSVQ